MQSAQPGIRMTSFTNPQRAYGAVCLHEAAGRAPKRRLCLVAIAGWNLRATLPSPSQLGLRIQTCQRVYDHWNILVGEMDARSNEKDATVSTSGRPYLEGGRYQACRPQQRRPLPPKRGVWGELELGLAPSPPADQAHANQPPRSRSDDDGQRYTEALLSDNVPHRSFLMRLKQHLYCARRHR
jgi:hypothetical protein